MDNKLLHAPALARRLGVPATWLKKEADAGRLPSIRAGRRYLFDVATVERALLARATSEQEPPAWDTQRKEVPDATSR